MEQKSSREVNDKILLTELIEFFWHYPEFSFWEILEKFKERKNNEKKES